MEGILSGFTAEVLRCAQDDSFFSGWLGLREGSLDCGEGLDLAEMGRSSAAPLHELAEIWNGDAVPCGKNKNPGWRPAPLRFVLFFVDAAWRRRSAIDAEYLRGGNAVGGIDKIFQFFAGLEEGNLFWRNFDLGAGLGIAANAPATLTRAEAAEAANFNLVAFLKSVD